MSTNACVTCRAGQRRPGTTSETVGRGATTITILHVPAEVCDACGETYFSGEIVDAMQAILADAITAGTRVAVIDFEAKVA